MSLSPRQYAVASLTVQVGEKKLAILELLKAARNPDVGFDRRQQSVTEAQSLLGEGRRLASMLGHVRAAGHAPGKLRTTEDDGAAHRVDVLRRLPEHIAAAEKEANEAIRKAGRTETRAAERRSLNETAAEKLSLVKSLKALKERLEAAR